MGVYCLEYIFMLPFVSTGMFNFDEEWLY